MNILLVEDNEVDIKITVRFLHRSYGDVEVFVARDGQEALDFLTLRGKYGGQDGAVTPDLIILDVVMPQLDGNAFLKEMRKDERFDHIPVIVFTSKSRDGEIRHVEGANGHVAKDLGGEDLVREINKVMSI